jgi:hypothetical protein
VYGEDLLAKTANQGGVETALTFAFHHIAECFTENPATLMA